MGCMGMVIGAIVVVGTVVLGVDLWKTQSGISVIICHSSFYQAYVLLIKTVYTTHIHIDTKYLPEVSGGYSYA